jgi:peptide/nickel transport system permease protein
MISAGAAEIPPEFEAQMRRIYGLDQPIYMQYFKWIRNIVLKGEFGYSFTYQRDARTIIVERLPMSFALAFSSMLFVWAVAMPIGIYSAVRQYSAADYAASFLGFIGLAVPNFLLALIFLFITYKYMGQAMIGLFSQQYADAPWSWAKVLDLLKHLWIPMIIIGTGGTAGLIRTMRANLLDELHKPYVVTARSKGLTERKVIFKYPVRVALNPFVSTVGWALPGLISGTTIVSIVLGLQTTGPLMLRALQAQDMYLAASFLLLLSALTVIGTFISDILLAWLDPRIRLTS